MAQKFDVCVLGATGLVGKTIIEILEQRDFPINKLYPLASARSAGEFIEFNGESIEVLDADNFDWSQAQIGFFSAGGATSAKYAPIACAGPLLAKELDALAHALATPKKPIAAIVGGSKVSTKLMVLENLADKVDQLIVGGGIANTFLAAAGKPVGMSLYEPDLIPAAQALMAKTSIPLPTDVVVGKVFSESAEAVVKLVDEVADDDMIFDIGPQTADQLAKLMVSMGTIIWNGPVGVFEFAQFGGGTETLANAIAASSGFSIAGGGDTLAAVDKYAIADKISYISTGGGAFLEYVEGKELPAVTILEHRA